MEGLSFSYRRGQEILAIFQEASFSLPSKGLYFVTSPIGSGKSTLLQILAGLLKPDRGTITFSGRSRFTTAYMPQHPTFVDHLNLQENARLPQEFFTLGPDEKKRFHDAFEQFEFARIQKTKASHLSGGERQRLALLQTLSKPAELYVFDEPTAALDARLKHRAMEMIQTLALHHLVLFVTHETQWVASGASTLLIQDKKIKVSSQGSSIKSTAHPPLVRPRFKKEKAIRNLFLIPFWPQISHGLTGLILCSFIAVLGSYHGLKDDLNAYHLQTFQDYNLFDLFITSSEPVEGSGFSLTTYRGFEPSERERLASIISGSFWVRSFAGWFPAQCTFGERVFALKPYVDTPADHLIFYTNFDFGRSAMEVTLPLSNLGSLTIAASLRFKRSPSWLGTPLTLYYPYYSMQRWLRFQLRSDAEGTFYDAWMAHEPSVFHLVIQGSSRKVLSSVKTLLDDGGLSILNDGLKEILFLNQAGLIGAFIGWIALVVLLFSEGLIGFFWMRHWLDKNRNFILWHRRFVNHLPRLKRSLFQGALRAQVPRMILLVAMVQLATLIASRLLNATVPMLVALGLPWLVATFFTATFALHVAWAVRSMNHD